MKASGATSITQEMWGKGPARAPSAPQFVPLSPRSVSHIDSVMAGIRTDPERTPVPALHHPRAAAGTGGINWAKASVETPPELVISWWKQLRRRTLSLDATVPPNTVATVLIPDRPGTRIVEPSGHAQPLGTEAGYPLPGFRPEKYAFRQTPV